MVCDKIEMRILFRICNWCVPHPKLLFHTQFHQKLFNIGLFDTSGKTANAKLVSLYLVISCQQGLMGHVIHS